ncbi:MAG: 6-bladed beta-propeller [Candidatus Dadabacteria bacterium]|nr:6-bladed beta-propeller [Candidatus Dadabacteria bacterium]
MNNNMAISEKLKAGIKTLLYSPCMRNSIVMLYSVITLLLIFLTTNAEFASAQTFSFRFGKGGAGNGEFNLPLAIAVDPQGNIWVADTFNHRIQKFNSKGEHLLNFGSFGSGDGQFNLPSGLAISNSGRLHIGDSNNRRVQVFTLNLGFVIRFGSNGVGNGQFFGGSLKQATDSSNNIYVLDNHLERVQKFSQNSNFILKFGDRGSGNGQFVNSEDIAIDRSDNIWVADRLGDRIQKFNSSGNHLLTVDTFRLRLNRPISLATDSSNNLYVGVECGTIGKFNSSGELILKFGVAACPNAIALDNQDNIYIAESNQKDYFVEVFRADTDRDGLKGSFDLDSDNDGIPDSLERRLGLSEVEALAETSQILEDGILDDPDGDGIPNELDLDSDGDGIPDVIEARGQDEDGDGLIDDFTDEDQDGLADRLMDAPLPVPDSDEHLIPDFLDGDSDNDGVTDVREAGGVDHDGDGILDDNEDLDKDGLADSVQTTAGGVPLPLLDLDGDGVPDFRDSNQNTGTGGGCSVAPMGKTSTLPLLYLLIPVFVLVRRLWRR